MKLVFSFLSKIILILGLIYVNVSFGVETLTCDTLFSEFAALNKPDQFSVVNLFARFRQNTLELLSQSEFKTPSHVRQIAKSLGTNYLKAIEILDNEDFDVAIQLDNKSREHIVSKGILNFRQSGRSQGTMTSRDLVESDYSAMTTGEFQTLPDSIKPKSAYLRPKIGSTLNPPEAIQYLGGDRVILKKSRILDRSTFTIGDSFNRRHYWRDLPDQYIANSWDQLFTPWSEKDLLIPALALGIRENKLGFPMFLLKETEKDFNEYINEFGRGTFFKNNVIIKTLEDGTIIYSPIGGTLDFPEGSPFSNSYVKWGASFDYVEIQIWDSIDASDIEAFEFTGIAPEDDVIQNFIANGIEVRDANFSPPRKVILK